jgi:eukaryotic-like serine/threonine-protein kinase
MLRFRDAKLGRVLAIYASGSFAVLQAIDLFQDRIDLPGWTFGAALTLLIIGLPVVITTAIVQTHDFKSRVVEKHFTWRRSLGAGALAFGILLSTTGYLARDRFGGSEKLDAHLVAVFPFRVSGAESSLEYLSEGMVDVLAAKLSGESGMRAADPRTAIAAYGRIDNERPELEQIIRAARSIGARNVIVGEVAGTPSQLTINASLINTRTGRSVQHFVTGPADSLAKRVDELAAVLLSLEAGEPRDRLAALTTTSLPALRSYLAAEAAARHSDHPDAMRAYASALDADSTFALAALGIIVQATWGGTAVLPDGSVERARRIAFEQRSRLSELDRLKLSGFLTSNYPLPSGEVPKCKVWPKVVARAPDRAEAWHHMADCYYHFGEYLGLADWQERARINFEKSLALDSTFLPNLEHLIPLAVIRRDLAEVRKLAALAERQNAKAAFMNEARWWSRYLEGRPLTELVMIDSLVNGKTNPIYLTTGRALVAHQLLMRHTEDVALADTLLGLAMVRGKTMAAGDVPASLGAYITMMRGQHTEAVRYLSKLGTVNKGGGAQNVLFAAMYADIPRELAAPYADSLERRLGALPEDSIREDWRNPLCALEQWRLWQGDASRTERTLRLLRSDVPDPAIRRVRRPTAVLCAEVVEAVRATVLKQPNAVALALRVDSLSAEYPQYAGFHFTMRIAASRLLELNGRLPEARAAVRRVAYDIFWPHYYGSQLLQGARLSAKVGDKEEAIRNYRTYLAFRTHADSSGRAVDQQVRHELEALTAKR